MQNYSMVAHALEGLTSQPDQIPVVDAKRESQDEARPKLPSLDDFRRAIPANCFKRDLVKSVRYLIQDFVILAGLYLTVPYFEHFGGIAGLMLWYCFMGVFGFSLFVVGHDCLHGSFSDYRLLNDILGHVAFAPLLSPYFPWQKTHKIHHSFTNHLEKDMGHPWNQEKHWVTWPIWMKYFSAFPISGWIKWFPVYTVFGYSDGSHFWPGSRLFKDYEDQIKCIISGVTCAVCAFVAYAITGDLYTMTKYYLIPLSFFGLMLVIVTYLQHTDEQAEIYEPEEWWFVRGQSQTIDRTYGLGLDHAMHHITDGHVAHHFFSKIPHYNLIAATDGIKQVLGPYAGTQYGYKHEMTHDFFFRYIWYCVKLDYLVYKCKGIMQYRSGKEANLKKLQ